MLKRFYGSLLLILERLVKKRGRRTRPKKRPKALLLIDWPNLEINARRDNIGKTAGFSFVEELEKVMVQIAQDIGPIREALAFITEDERGLVGPSGADSICKRLYGLNIDCKVCPRVLDKSGKPVDTTDEQIIKHGLREFSKVSDPSNFCLVLGSGDKDFVHMLVEARTKYGITKIAIVAGDINSLAADLMPFAWINPKTGKRAIYILSNT